jgi:hypothetical protein|tara:strand:- start:122 stop:550 length:429 start_codon:yes stop_codon:yes gene_type:complete
MGDDLDYQKELIRQQQDPRHDQSPFKIDIECPITGTDYVTTVTPGDFTYTYDSITSASASDTITIGSGDYSFAGNDITYTVEGIDDCIPSKDFVTHIPSLEKIEKMCEQYPGLKKAYEHFVFAYKLTQQDYDGKLKAGELDD